jgi:uncharacterized protein (DUF1015 family)
MSEPFLKPFKGLLYNREKVGDIGRCVCPPYDIISDPSRYYQQSPFNAIRLELPLAENGLDGYDTARKTLDEWLSQGIVTPDSSESVYVYDQEFLVNGILRKRRGIVPAVRLDNTRILTHEETRKKAREDREKLIERLTTFTSLVFAMYDDSSREVGELVSAAEKEQLCDFTDEFGIRNTFYRMNKPREMADLSALMETKLLYIADGHHRLSVSYKLGLAYLAIYLTDMNGDGIAILPYHRVLKLNEKKPVTALTARLERYFDVKEIPRWEGEELTRLIDAASAASRLSFYIYSSEEKRSLLFFEQKKTIDFDPDGADTLRNLRVNAIHAGVLKHLLGVKDEEISFLNDPGEATTLVDAGEYDFAVFVPATSVQEVRDVAVNKLYMPPKSTYFYPKVTTGLVFYKYA